MATKQTPLTKAQMEHARLVERIHEVHMELSALRKQRLTVAYNIRRLIKNGKQI